MGAAGWGTLALLLGPPSQGPWAWDPTGLMALLSPGPGGFSWGCLS